ncbi:MAG: ATP-binding protein [Leptolyngbya sp. SIO1D8]|nr:ATP-binding protein [Leptolyngbya sp. SIO1D8]
MSSEEFFKPVKDRLYEFDFHRLFIEVLGWNQPSNDRAESVTVEEVTYERRRIAEMSAVPVFEVTAPDGEIPKGEERAKIYKAITESFAENLLIFINGDRTRSLWYWAKREGAKFYPRTDSYIKGQPVDLLLSKIGGLKIALDELGPDGELPVVEVADRLQKSLDVEKVTKKFYQAFQLEHQEFLGYVQGIDNEGDRRWYTSVILNRLMFVYFLQKKGFINNNDLKYLRKQLTASQKRGPDRFYSEFLEALFFEGLAKPERDRAPEVRQLLGQVCYLNGGLFLKHSIELNERYDIHIPDEAFDRVFTLFDKYSWHLDDRPGGKPDEINPDVLGYIFEKYINQKAFGAYYTRPEITEYLCDRTINKLILDRVNAAMAQQPRDPREIQAFESIDDMVMHMDAAICRHLVMGDDAILRNLSLLDPACGSGAFLIAAMKTLIRIYEKVVGVAQFSTDHKLRNWLDQVNRDHPSISYFIKKRIITDNLYGVDIMEEAVEIAKLRLFLALVSSAMTVEELEPLPNIDFNIMAGNSLIGLIRVDEESFDAVGDSEFQQGNLLQLDAANSYHQILEEKNRSIELYKKHSFLHKDETGELDQEDRLQQLRTHIEQVNRESEEKLNQLLLNEFTQRLGIKFEQAQLKGRPKKRNLTIADIEAQKPFHWGYHFDKVIEKRGGFDSIITNPPWEIFKPNAREFFFQHNELVIKSKMDIKQFQKAQKKLLQDPAIAEAWLEYQSQYPHISAYYRSAEQYKNQIAIVNGRRAGTDINLYKLFLEQCFNLLKPGGECGIIIPTGIYTDLGAKQLREMLFSQCQIDALYGISNERFIFEGVDHRFKFSLLTFDKGGPTDHFPAAFRIDPREAISKERIGYFLSNRDEHIQIEVPLIRKLSPDSLSVMEFKNELDIQIAKKMSQFPLLGEKIDGKWNLKLTAEFHMTGDSKLFQSEAAEGRLPLYEGKMIHQFEHQLAEPRYWIDEQAGRERILKRGEVDTGQKLAYQSYRLAFRDVARSTDIRTMIATVLPRNIFTGNTIINSYQPQSISEILVIASILNSFAWDSMIRQKVAAHCNMFYVYQTPTPRLEKGDRYFSEIVERAAKLICTTPAFDNLAAEVGLDSHTNGVTDDTERAQLRAELDGMIAHLYGLTEEEFAHILATFPIVSESVKISALNAYRDVERGLLS